MANSARATLQLTVQYDPNLTDPEALATAADRLLETSLSTPGILDEYGNPVFGEFVCPNRHYAIYCMATDELMLESFGRFTREEVARESIDEADPRLADDLLVVSIVGIPPRNGEEASDES